MKPTFPHVVGLVGLTCALLLPFGAFFPLQSSFVTLALTEEFRNVPAALVMFVSYMFQHESANLHWTLNFIFLFWMGTVLENAIGHKRMTIFVAVTGITAGIVHYIADPYLATPVIGLSGVLFAIFATLAVATPDFALIGIPGTSITLVRMWQLALLLFGLQLYGFLENTAGDKSAYWIHFGGIVSGLILWQFWLKEPLERFKRSDAGARLLG